MPKTQLVTSKIPVACLAPALTDESLARYKELGATISDVETRDAYDTLLKCVDKWWNLPESTAKPNYWTTLHRGKSATFAETPLTDELVQELDSVTPWMKELNTLSNEQGTGLFDSLPNGELRNAAFHLLWHVKEITLDREPITADKIA